MQQTTAYLRKNNNSMQVLEWDTAAINDSMIETAVCKTYGRGQNHCLIGW